MISRKYRYLLVLARERHFGKAAAACHISPSTLSAAIRDLELELGVVVVERDRHFCGLTPEGTLVVECAHRIIANEEMMQQALSSMHKGLSGHFRLGVIPTALTVVATLTTSLLRRHPDITIDIRSFNMHDICNQIREYELDAGIIYANTENSEKNLMTIPLWQESHVLLTSDMARFAGRDTISWHEASQLPLCLLTPDMQNRKLIDQVFAEMQIQIKPALQTNSMISMLAHVCCGYWSAIVPSSVFDRLGVPDGAMVLQLVEPKTDWWTGLVLPDREPRSSIADALLAEAKLLTDTFGFIEHTLKKSQFTND